MGSQLVEKLKSRPDSVLLELPTKNLGEATAVIAARLKLSTNASLSLFAKIIQLGHGDVHGFIISRSTIWRQRISGEKKVADVIFNKFAKSLLDDSKVSVVVQWDGKQVKYQIGALEERLGIILHMLPDGHMWYVSEELVVLALADSDYDMDMRSQLAARLLATARPGVFRPGKPEMKVHLLRNQQPDTPQLYQFIGEHSWLLFELFQLDSTWLGLPVDQ